MKARYEPPGPFASDRSPILVIPFEGSVYSMNEQPAHVAYNMHPSTVLTPPGWKHVSIHPDAGGRFKVCGYASATVWLPGDLKALGIKVKAGKVWGLTKDRALELGGEIEAAMVRAEAGHPLPKSKEEPPPANTAAPDQRPKKAAVKDQPTFL